MRNKSFPYGTSTTRRLHCWNRPHWYGEDNQVDQTTITNHKSKQHQGPRAICSWPFLFSGPAYRRTISVVHIGGAYRRIHQPPTTTRTRTRTNEREWINAASRRPGNGRRTDDHPGDDRTRTHPPRRPQSSTRRSPDDGRQHPGILTQYQNHPAIDQIPPVLISPHCQFTTGPPRPDLVPNRPEAHPNQDRRF
jgi:hypothetical protein